METFNFIEVCAGCGGLSSGLISAGLRPIFLNDNNKDCCKTLKLNHPDIEIKCCSFIDIDFSEYENKVDLLTGGVPCQSFSQAGSRKGLEDSRGLLMLEFIKIIGIVKPKIFMIENVKGLKTHNKGKTLKNIFKEILKFGLYKIIFKTLKAIEYDVPQKRERIIIIGTLKKYETRFLFPSPKKEIITLKNVLTDVPESECAEYSEEKKELFKLIPQGGCWTSLPKELQKKYLGSSYTSGGGKRGILRRLSMDEPCLTLLCSPSQKQTERCHPLEIRPLSIREYARIQTFDDTFEFYGSRSSKYKQIGNAVSVKLAFELGKSIIGYLKKISIKLGEK